MRYLLDVNLVLSLLDTKHAFHDSAHQWFETRGPLTFLTCPIVQNGFIRIASQVRYPNRLGHAGEVRAFLQRFVKDPRHEFCMNNISLLDDDLLLTSETLLPAQVTDLYLVALAVHNRAKLATFDHSIPANMIKNGDQAIEVLKA